MDNMSTSGVLTSKMVSFFSFTSLLRPSWEAVATLIVLIILFQLTLGIYRAFFDSLCGYPGPKLWAASVIPECIYKTQGTLDFELASLHEIYGPVIRTTPNSLCYTSSDAWRDIYAAKPQLIKNYKGCPPPGSNGVNAFIFEPDDDLHAKYRDGFSEKALRDQKPIIKTYIDLFMKTLREKKGTVNMNDMFQFIMLDIIGDLTFGEPFQCLEKDDMNTWVRNVFSFVKSFWIITAVRKFEPLATIFFFMASHLTSFEDIKVTHQNVVFEKLNRRVLMDDARQDFMTYVLKHKDQEDGMNSQEIDENSQMFIIAGAETTGSLLSGTLYYLLSNRSSLDKTVEEIRSAFPKEDDIDLSQVLQLPYLNAVILEVLRIFPPVPQGVQRITGPKGNIIAGKYVPANTLVGVNHWAAYHTSTNFRDPYIFDPERWLGNKKYSEDRKNAFKPFSYGPRNCIGQALALAEAKLIIATLLWSFDITICEESKNWAQGARPYGVWEKAALMVALKAVVEV